jgi:predicted nucleotidyltransferase
MKSRSEWEGIFGTWSRGPQKTETDRIENTKRAIQDAIRNDDKLKSRNIQVFVQGSYKNTVNVKKDSDIDIGVLCFDTFYDEYDSEEVKTYQKQYFSPATYDYSTFKNEVETALVNKFGRSAVTRGNKAFDIKATSARVEADVAAFFEHRRYYARDKYYSGVQMYTDNGNKIINWPEQHYNNGVDKNSKTYRRYKRSVRILKKLKNAMENHNYIDQDRISGFFIECLVWNVPNNYFNYDSHYDRIKAIITYLYNETKKEEIINDWGEVSDLKYVFRGKNRGIADANYFVLKAWRYVGYTND